MKAKHFKVILPMLTAVLILGGCGTGSTTQKDILETANIEYEKAETEHITESTEISLDEQTETEQIEQVEQTEGMNGNAAGDIYVPTEEDLTIEDEATLAIQEAEEADEQLESEPEESKSDYTVVSMDAKTMYAQRSVNLRQGPSTSYDKVGSLSTNQKVTVTGKVTMDNGTWYQLSTGEFVSSKYLKDSKVKVDDNTSNSNQNQSTKNEDTNTSSNEQQSPNTPSEDGKTATGEPKGDGSGSSRENRGGGSNGEGGVSGGNLH